MAMGMGWGAGHGLLRVWWCSSLLLLFLTSVLIYSWAHIIITRYDAHRIVGATDQEICIPIHHHHHFRPKHETIDEALLLPPPSGPHPHDHFHLSPLSLGFRRLIERDV